MTLDAVDTLCLACDLSAWTGDPRRCRWDNETLRPGRTRWCSRLCMEEWQENHVWRQARQAVRRRDGLRCTACLERDPVAHVHHRTPCAGIRTMSCAHHLANLETLCAGCHQAAHASEAA